MVDYLFHSSSCVLTRFRKCSCLEEKIEVFFFYHRHDLEASHTRFFGHLWHERAVTACPLPARMSARTCSMDTSPSKRPLVARTSHLNRLKIFTSDYVNCDCVLEQLSFCICVNGHENVFYKTYVQSTCAGKVYSWNGFLPRKSYLCLGDILSVTVSKCRSGEYSFPQTERLLWTVL